jgi:hypothetical protein
MAIFGEYTATERQRQLEVLIEVWQRHDDKDEVLLYFQNAMATRFKDEPTTVKGRLARQAHYRYTWANNYKSPMMYDIRMLRENGVELKKLPHKWSVNFDKLKGLADDTLLQHVKRQLC